MNLPDLPEGEDMGTTKVGRLTCQIVGFTKAQMQEYGRQCAEAMRQACIAECESVRKWPSLGPKDCINNIQEVEIE